MQCAMIVQIDGSIMNFVQWTETKSLLQTWLCVQRLINFFALKNILVEQNFRIPSQKKSKIKAFAIFQLISLEKWT